MRSVALAARPDWPSFFRKITDRPVWWPGFMDPWVMTHSLRSRPDSRLALTC
jgi:hypothetical protein